MSKVQQESPPSQSSPQRCSGFRQQSSVESKLNLEEKKGREKSAVESKSEPNKLPIYFNESDVSKKE